MAPIRILGKVSLSEEITMLERLKGTLVSAREQARFIADSTGDAETKDRLGWTAVRAKCEIDGVDLFLYRAKEAQRVNSEETGRVTLREDLGR